MTAQTVPSRATPSCPPRIGCGTAWSTSAVPASPGTETPRKVGANAKFHRCVDGVCAHFPGNSAGSGEEGRQLLGKPGQLGAFLGEQQAVREAVVVPTRARADTEVAEERLADHRVLVAAEHVLQVLAPLDDL